jgi:hypothetical protein
VWGPIQRRVFDDTGPQTISTATFLKNVPRESCTHAWTHSGCTNTNTREQERHLFSGQGHMLSEGHILPAPRGVHYTHTRSSRHPQVQAQEMRTFKAVGGDISPDKLQERSLLVIDVSSSFVSFCLTVLESWKRTDDARAGSRCDSRYSFLRVRVRKGLRLAVRLSCACKCFECTEVAITQHERICAPAIHLPSGSCTVSNVDV